jgi:hypothetical protein
MQTECGSLAAWEIEADPPGWVTGPALKPSGAAWG